MPDTFQLRWWSDPRQWLRTLLMLDDTPHHIALGTAIGMFVAFTPTVGIQMVLLLLLAVLVRPVFRFNKVAGLIAVYITNPLTVVPIYWFNYKIGTLCFASTISKEEFAAIFQYDGLREWWTSMTRLFVDVGVPLMVGSLVVAAICSLATYPLMLRLLRHVRAPRIKNWETPGEQNWEDPAERAVDKKTLTRQPLGL
jgi:uncharacterized protein (DUF2062 family)